MKRIIRSSAPGISLSAVAAAVLMSCQPVPALAQLAESKANDAALRQINAPTAWSRGFTGKGIKISVVDTGADLKNADLKNVISSYSAYGAISDKNYGHGTSMIGIAAGAKNGVGVIGVAYDASVLAYAGGINGNLNQTDVINGIVWSGNNKADVINLSLGYSLSSASFASSFKNVKGGYAPVISSGYLNTSMLSALQSATSKGSIIVMAAGNDGNPVPTSPANLAVKTDSAGNLILGGQAVIVGAVDSNNVIAKFSNRAGNICQNVVGLTCNDKIQVKDYFLVAPGGSTIWSSSANTASGITSGVGTSQAAAFVSGSVAVIKQAWPAVKPADIVQILLKTATDLGAPGVDEIYGNGLVNLDRATNPVGTLSIAKVGGTTPVGKLALTSTAIGTGSIGAQSFSSSVVLKNTQVIDSFGRNYTADLSRTVVGVVPNQYQGISAYSNLSNSEVKTYSFSLGNISSTMFGSDNLGGFRIDQQFAGGYSLGFELGSASEKGAAMGMTGSGALAVGNSDTVWRTIHLGRQVGSASLFGSVAFGDTNPRTTSDSLINSISRLRSESYTVGVKFSGIANNNDSLTVQVTELPHITSGSVTLSGVTGYSYSNITEDGAVATPVVTSETIGLVSSYRQYASGVSYQRNVDRSSSVMVGAQLISDNQGGELRSSVFGKYTLTF